MNRIEYLKELLGLPNIYNPIVSKDGAWIAWTWFRIGPGADVFAVAVDGSRKPLRLTNSEENTYLVSWTPGSRGVIVSEDIGGNERARLFLVYLEEPCKMIPLTEPEPNYYIRGGELHPNGKWLFYGANWDINSNEEIGPTWLYRQDLTTGNRKPIAKPERAGEFYMELNSTGSYILYSRSDLHPAGIQVWLVDVEGRENREILNFGPDAKVYAKWLPNGEEIVFIAQLKDGKKVGIWNMKTNQTCWIVADLKRDIEEVLVPPVSDCLVFLQLKNARVCSSIYQLKSGLELAFPSCPGNLVPLVPVKERLWATEYYSSTQPTDLVLLSLEEVEPENFLSLTRVWEKTRLRPKDLFPAEEVAWESTDGLPIHGWLYRPKGKPKGTIVYVHGGPTSCSQDRINAQIQFFAHEGFMVLDPNYRGSTGFGLEFQEKIKEDGFGGREQEDILTGIKKILDQEAAEKGKIGITGTSYGGYSSWWAITHYPPESIKAAIPICGMTDLIVDYHTTRPDLRTYSEEMMGGSPNERLERYRERSPVNYIQNIKGRLLIVQGQNDPNVTPENVKVVKSLLEKWRVDFEILEFEDEGHGISKPRNQETLFLKMMEFFEKAFADLEAEEHGEQNLEPAEGLEPPTS